MMQRKYAVITSTEKKQDNRQNLSQPAACNSANSKKKGRGKEKHAQQRKLHQVQVGRNFWKERLPIRRQDLEKPVIMQRLAGKIGIQRGNIRRTNAPENSH